MEREVTYNPAYSGSKNFTQHQVKTANANGFAAATDDYMERAHTQFLVVDNDGW